MVLQHSYECSKCRALLQKESIKMCGGCKIMGYCSKDCQKADWKEHKQGCKGAKTGTAAHARHPVIKVVERMAEEPEIMSQIDGILVKALDLPNHPENAQNFAVALSARVESTDMKLAKERMVALMAGREPPPLPGKVPKLFQIGKAAMIPNASVPEGLDRIADAMTKQVQEMGYLKSGSKDLLVRAMWVAEEGSQATLYFCRLITGEMLEEIAGWKQPTEDGEGHLDEPVKTEELIQAFDWRAFNEPDMKQKLTVMVDTRG